MLGCKIIEDWIRRTRPSICTPRASNSSFSFAKAPSSVVQTGVKSAGCENRIVHFPLRNSWNLILPCVVCASKSGATEPILRRGCSAGMAMPRRKGVAAGRWMRSAGRAAERRAREAARGMIADILEVERGQLVGGVAQMFWISSRRQFRLVSGLDGNGVISTREERPGRCFILCAWLGQREVKSTLITLRVWVYLVSVVRLHS